jgi:dTDP-4-amino-4,6-dideoxygalactose transaminase
LYSNATIFSFHPVKNITTGEGGLLLTNDAGIFKKARMSRSHGIDYDERDDAQSHGVDPWVYQQKTLGFNYRMSDIHAALGISQLKKLSKFIKRRNDIANYYVDQLKCLEPQIFLPRLSDKNYYSAFHLFQFHVNQDICKYSRREIYDKLLVGGVKSNVHYRPIYLHPYYNKRFSNIFLNGASQFYEGVLCLPNYYGLSDVDLMRIVQLVKTVFR